MTKNEFIELVSGLGGAEVYFCIPGNGANIGKFWDFVGLAWVTPITADCKVFATEYNSDGTVSIYRADVIPPSTGGPFIIYCYRVSTGKLQGQDITDDKSDFALTSDYDAAKTAASQSSVDVIPINPLLDNDVRLDNLDAPISGIEVGSIVALPAMQGQIYTAVAVQSKEVIIIRGDTPRITFDLNHDYTGWTVKFGAKSKPDDTTYVIDVKDGVWTSAANGEGYVDLTAAETAEAQKLYAELELRNGDQRLTAIKFILKIIEDVIK